MPRKSTPKWDLTADMVESCSCNFLCPCWFGVQDLMKMDQGWCDSAFLFRIRSGRSDGVDLKNRIVAFAIDFPGPTLFDGRATARVYVDAGASAAQTKELEAIFQGRRGGPMQVIGGFVTNWLPTETTKIDAKESRGTLTATVGRFGVIRSTRLKDEAGKPVTLHNAGMAKSVAVDVLEVAPSRTQWTDLALPRKFETRSGAAATVKWAA